MIARLVLDPNFSDPLGFIFCLALMGLTAVYFIVEYILRRKKP